MNGGSWCMIPDIALKDDRLVANAKILYGKIICLSGRRGFCIASNHELSGEIGGVDERSIQRYIKQLEDTQYVRVDHHNEARMVYATLGMAMHAEDVESEEEEEEPAYDFACDQLFNFWLSELERASEQWRVTYRRRNRTDKRMRKIAARLKDGYSTEAIKHAIRGCVWNEFNITNGHTDIVLICRSEEQVEKYMAKWDAIQRADATTERNEFAEYEG